MASNVGAADVVIARIAQVTNANMTRLERLNASGEWEEVTVDFTVPISNEGILKDAPGLVVSAGELPGGMYRWSGSLSTFEVAPEAELHPSPLGPMPSLAITRPTPGSSRDRGGCSHGGDNVCQFPDRTGLLIRLPDIPVEERAYAANYVVRATDQSSGQRWIRIGSCPLSAMRAEVVLSFFLDGDVDVCVEIAGLGWDGALGETVKLNCL